MNAQHLILTDRGNEPFAIEEVRRAYHGSDLRVISPGLVSASFHLQPEAPPTLVFTRQVLPSAETRQASSILHWAECLFDAVATLPEHKPWQLHVIPQYGQGRAGQNRCNLIHQALLGLLHRKRRTLARSLQLGPTPFRADDSLVQLLLTAPDRAFLSVVHSPVPVQLRRIVSPFPKGEIPVECDKSAPSRAFAKLLEAERRMGCQIAAGEQCVDLGASPGSWTYIALKRGASVTAVDRAPLRPDLMSHPRLRFEKGDAFSYGPDCRVDWLLCDVIAAPLRTVDLLLSWLREKRAGRFVVTIKFKGADEYGLLERLKHALPALCEEFYLTHLCANRNEVCAFGSVRSTT